MKRKKWDTEAKVMKWEKWDTEARDARIGTSIDSFYKYLLKPAFHSIDQAPAGLTAPHGHIHIKRSKVQD
ncbi:hypothetical protein LguiA_012307 [Lonicera macranthoides]